MKRNSPPCPSHAPISTSESVHHPPYLALIFIPTTSLPRFGIQFAPQKHRTPNPLLLTMTTLYDRIGGAPVIETLIPAFYARVLADPNLSPFFKHASMDSLQGMQQQFFAMALGGPVAYTGRPLGSVHHGRGITTSHFSAFVKHLLETLSAIGISSQEADEVIARIDTFANEITGTSY